MYVIFFFILVFSNVYLWIYVFIEKIIYLFRCFVIYLKDIYVFGKLVVLF